MVDRDDAERFKELCRAAAQAQARAIELAKRATELIRTTRAVRENTTDLVRHCRKWRYANRTFPDVAPPES